MAIQNDDLILVNRGGVDYKAKIEDIPTADVDLSLYAKLDGENKETSTLTNYKSFETRAGQKLYDQGAEFTNLTVGGRTRLGSTDFSGAILADGDSVDISGFRNVIADKFIGDGSDLTNLPTADVDLSEYAKLDGEGQEIINTAKFQCQNKSSYHDNMTVKAPFGEFIDTLKATKIKGPSSEYVSTIGVINLEVDQNLVLNDAPIQGASTITAQEFVGDGSKLTNLPIPIVEGNVLFKGSVETEADLPATDNKVGDMWHVNDDDSLHAWGEDGAWHEVGASTNIDLSEYAKLNDQNQNIVAYDYTTVNPNAYFGPGYASMERWRAFVGFIRSGLHIGALDTSDPDEDVYDVADWSPTLYLSPNSISFQTAADENGDRKEQFGVDSAGLGSFAGGVRIGGTFGDPEIDLLPDGTAEFSGTVTATEFIGDGSNLTNLPTSDVDLSEYAKLDDNQQRIVAYQYTTINPDCRLEPGGLYTDNVYASRNGGIEGGRISGHTIVGHGEDAAIGNFKTISGTEHFGDKYQCQNPDSYLDNYGLKTEDGEFTGHITVNGWVESNTVEANVLTAKEHVTGRADSTISGFKTITATEFHGDGSNLTGVMPLDLRTLPALP